MSFFILLIFRVLFFTGNKNTFSYQASLMNAPDLPPWIHYTYSNHHHKGFLYGVAPKDQGDFKVYMTKYLSY